MFGKTLKLLGVLNIAPGEIKRQLRKKFRIGIAGSPGFVSNFEEILAGGMVLDETIPEKAEKKSDFIRILKMPVTEEVRRNLKTDMIVYLLKLEDVTGENLKNYKEIFKLKPPARLFIEEPQAYEEKENIYRMIDELYISGFEWIKPPTPETIEEKDDVLIRINPKIEMAMSYRFPILRKAMARKLTHDTSVQNMIIALASSLPANIPIIGIIIGLMAVAGETTVLTINQLKLCIQLAGIYGLDMNLQDRIRELWPLIGTAIGFRALARSLIGFIPIAGPAIKGTIAYGGTFTVGETVRWYYEFGRAMTDEEKKGLYRQARINALESLRKHLHKFKSGDTRDETDGEERVDVRDIEKEIDSLENEFKRMDPVHPSENPEIIRYDSHLNSEQERMLMDEMDDMEKEEKKEKKIKGDAGKGRVETIEKSVAEEEEK